MASHGLRNLRRPFVATHSPLGMKDKGGQRIPFEQRAQKAAEFLGSVFWGAPAATRNPTQPSIQPSRVVTEDLGMDLNDISMKELF